MAEGVPLGDRKKEISGGTTEGGENGLSFLRPEVRLLLCCARKDIEPRQRKEMEAYLQSPVDWTFLVKTAQDHGLLLFLYRALWKNFAERVPKNRKTFLFNLRRNVLLTAELCKLLKLFETEGIPTIPLKGPVLTVSLYGDLGMRPFSDLDLLFQKRDVPKAKALLVAEGYRIPFSLTAAHKEVFLQGDSEAAMVRTDGRTIVEILWGTPGDFPIALDFAPFWKRLEKQSFEGQAILTFAPEDWVLYLCLHQATHGWNSLLWLSDLDALIHKYPGMDWNGLVGRAEKFRCRR
ncbi:MAG: nucleotidyltransferase family protein, partial [Deltaproteobacteria bacterium]|nr:nucleotidyltransferase family protein [Deltaproteobacteria bacterium]